MVKKQVMYREEARVYDLIYSSKDYKKETKILKNLIKKYKKSGGKELLEVACGTGKYLEYLKKDFHCTGIDLNEGMVKIAKKKFPNIKIIKANMINFNLNKKFDILLCLFSSIGYVKTYKNLEKTIMSFERHLKKGGILIISPWLTKSRYKVGFPHLDTYIDNKIKVARASVAKKKGDISIIDFHFLVAEKNKEVKHFIDRHETGLFETDKILQFMKKTGFKAKFLKKGLMKDRRFPDRGLFIGVKK